MVRMQFTFGQLSQQNMQSKICLFKTIAFLLIWRISEAEAVHKLDVMWSIYKAF